MAKNTPVVEEEVATEEKEEVAVPEKTGKFKLAVEGQATVSWKGQSRVYTEELHGSKFLDLAKEFAQKIDGVVA